VTAAGRRVLLLGGDGFVARELARDLPLLGWEVLSTSRRPGAALRLDLADPDAFVPPPGVAAAVLVAAVARPAACEADPDGSRLVNADAPARLLPRLAGAGVRVLALSSDKVFDGTVPMRRRDDPPCPAGEYGRQKAAMEASALAAGAAVLRLSRVVAPGFALFAGWRADLAAGRPITPFADMTLAPVEARRVAALVSAILLSGGDGVYQASGDRDLTYAEAAQFLAAAWGADPALVRPLPAPVAVAGARLPAHTTLDMSRERGEFGVGNADALACVRLAAGVREGLPMRVPDPGSL
jgi:dTDP-4-dehydrorhamnose reductase